MIGELEMHTANDIAFELHKRQNQIFAFVYKDQLTDTYKYTINYGGDKREGIVLYNELKYFLKLMKEGLDKG